MSHSRKTCDWCGRKCSRPPECAYKGFTCSCRFFALHGHQGEECSHILAVRIFIEAEKKRAKL